jgi:hypothetical protein
LIQAKQKFSRPLLATVIRLGVIAPNRERCLQIARNLIGTLQAISSPSGNELIALHNENISVENQIRYLRNRHSNRNGMLLNIAELAALAHFPSASVRSEKLRRDEQQTKAVPAIALGHRLILGENRHNGQSRSASLSIEQRTRHMHILGSTGSGKSSILLNFIKQDLNAGEGLCVIEPHGDLIESVIENVPDNRLDDVILFDPADSEFPIGFIDAFLRQKLVRNIVCQKRTRLDFRKIMDGRKILLVKLSQGIISTENSHLLGTFLVSKLHQIALSRQDATNRSFCAVYIDEFHNFIAPSLESILSGIRKYNIGLHLSHQELRQMQSRSQEVAASVLSNCYTRICFRLSETDAEKLSSGFSSFDAKALQNLSIGKSIARIERADYDFNLKTALLPRVEETVTKRRRNQILQNTREKYAKPRSEVELEIVGQRRTANANNVIQQQIESANQNANIDKTVRQKAQNIKYDTQVEAPRISGNLEVKNGRGGQHHRELQAVIRRVAETYGLQVQIEKSVSAGAGFVDVSLERENLKIACEVSVTSTAEYETKNVLKSLEAGYDYALAVVSDQKKIPSLDAKLSSQLSSEQLKKVKTLGLTGLITFLRELTAPKETGHKKRGKPAGQRLNFTEACKFFNIGFDSLPLDTRRQNSLLSSGTRVPV